MSMKSLITLDPFDATHALVTSPFASPRALATVRLAVGVYTFCTLVVSLIGDGTGFFSYFTHLSYTGLCAYFFASGTQTLVYAMRLGTMKARMDVDVEYPLQRWPRALQLLHLALLSTIRVFPILVSVVFWGVISNGHTFDSSYDTWSAISVHLLNSVFALFEIFFTNTPRSEWIFLPLGLLLLAMYVGIVYITHTVEGFYAYKFMAPNGKPLSLALHILAVGAAYVVCFVVVYGFVAGRQWLVARSRSASDQNSTLQRAESDLSEMGEMKV
ncbi:unnamed protein product [Mycena citricolor]|uniref:FAR-17a/AIG1-like protein n=1 Tax=Mycena citricolor TaxID=2018698 RepID=A0AAD2HRS2_9AGAR|nr:unnamed protein product [Mycena citricolor]